MSFRLMHDPRLPAIPTLVKGKILLVDNDPQDLSFYATVLYMQGYQVVLCESFQEATPCLENNTFDIVILGTGGPSFDGRRVLERATRPDLHIPVLLLAGWVDMGVYTEAMSLGAVDYLEKAADPTELLRAIKIHLRYAAQPGLARLETRQAAESAGAVFPDILSTFKLGGQGEC
ncbi:MAG TPA: response regulator [Terriglobia bacterium]|nr:response regulator [Terriglobia bacterium]